MSNDDKDAPSNETAESFGVAPHERPVPRISIHAFCDTPDTNAALQSAASDRRLGKANIGIRPGGVTEAVAFFKQNPTPNLLIVETHAQGAAVLTELEQLANVCDETTK